jgi:hypothetical protein
MCVSLIVSMAAGPKKRVVFTLSDGVKFLSQRPKGIQAEIAGSDEGMVVVRKQETFDKFVHDRKCFMGRHCPKIEVPMGSNLLWFVGLLSIRTASCRFKPLLCDFHWDSRCVSARDGAVVSGGNYGNNAMAKTNHVYIVARMDERGVLSAPCHRHGQYIESSRLA